MSKTPTDRLSLSGPTMGTRWSVLFNSRKPVDVTALQTALQSAVDDVDAQMSTWNPSSDLMRLNAAPLGEWIALPSRLLTVLSAGLQISRFTNGAFEMNVGNAVQAWGFGAAAIDLAAIRSASSAPRTPAYDALQLNPDRSAALKTAPLALDLSGIAKGYAVDRLDGVLASHGISHALCAIDGELRALGTQSDRNPWAVAIENPNGENPNGENPNSATRAPHAMLALAEGAVATSGDYRHFLTVAGKRLSHTIDPRRGAPLVGSPASVSVLAADCMTADAMATALMVMGADAGPAFARQHSISALFLLRDGTSLQSIGTVAFSDAAKAV